MFCTAVACRSLLALVFGVSVFSKLRSRHAFAGFVAGARALLPAPVPAGLPVLGAAVAAEAAAAVLTVLPWTAPAGLALSCGLLIVFSWAIAAALRRGAPPPCPCFGPSARPVGPVHLVRNGLLAAAAVLGILATSAQHTAQPAAVLLALAAGALPAAVVINLDDIVDLFATGR